MVLFVLSQCGHTAKAYFLKHLPIPQRFRKWFLSSMVCPFTVWSHCCKGLTFLNTFLSLMGLGSGFLFYGLSFHSKVTLLRAYFLKHLPTPQRFRKWFLSSMVCPFTVWLHCCKGLTFLNTFLSPKGLGSGFSILLINGFVCPFTVWSHC